MQNEWAEQNWIPLKKLVKDVLGLMPSVDVKFNDDKKEIYAYDNVVMVSCENIQKKTIKGIRSYPAWFICAVDPNSGDEIKTEFSNNNSVAASKLASLCFELALNDWVENRLDFCEAGIN